MQNNEEIIKKYLPILQSLPYAQWLSKGRMVEYINNLAQEGVDIDWFLERHKGIGSSEIGALIAHRKNSQRKAGEHFYRTINTAHEVVVEKLLGKIRRSRKEETERQDNFQRGKRLEQVVAAILVYQLQLKGHTVSIDQEVMDFCKKESAPHSQYKWLKGNNVDLVLLVDNKRVLVDIKCPSEAMLASFKRDEEAYLFGYEAQLHQFKLWLNDKGIHIDEMMIGAFDYKSASVTELSIPYNEEMDADILEAGEHFWNNYILTGKYPGYVYEYDTVYQPNNVPENFYKLAGKIASYKAIEENANERFKEARTELEEKIKKMAVRDSTVFELGCYTGRSRLVQQLNKEEILHAAKTVGLPLEKYKKSYRRMYTALKKKLPDSRHPELRIENLATIVNRVTVRKASKRNPASELMNAVSIQAADYVEEVSAKLQNEQYSIIDVIKDNALSEFERKEVYKSLPKQQQQNNVTTQQQPALESEPIKQQHQSQEHVMGLQMPVFGPLSLDNNAPPIMTNAQTNPASSTVSIPPQPQMQAPAEQFADKLIQHESTAPTETEAYDYSIDDDMDFDYGAIAMTR